jgi:hypothetical protein
MKINNFLILTALFICGCDCHYRNAQNYVQCLENHKGNEQFCVKIKSQYPANTCRPIDFEKDGKN